MGSSDVLNYLADASVRSLCLAVAAMLALTAVRTRSAPVKHAVWTAVVCAMLALPLLSVALPSIPLRVLQPAPALIEPLPELVSGPQAAAPTAVPASEPRRSLPGWPVAAVSVYVLGAAFLLGKLALGYLLSRRLVKRSAPIDGATVAVPGAALAESKAVSVPLTIGWLHPHILLPTCWREWDRAKLEAVLAHEAAHVARRDWLVAALARLNTSVFWFHPLAWWMERKLAALAEEACDEASLLANGDRERYAQVLLEMAEAVRAADGRLAWHAVAMARRSQVRQRVEAILDESRRLSRGMTKARWAAVLLCAVPLAYGAAAVRIEQAQAPVQIETKTPWPPGSYMDTVSRGNGLSAEEAKRLEGYLQANPEDITARGSLIAYYTLHGVREPRLKHIFWFVENHPESEIAGFTSAGISARGGPLNSESDHARARDLWLEQIRTHEKDPRVLVNAVKFFVRPGGDLAMAADLLKRVSTIDRSKQILGSLYAMVIVGALRPRDARAGELPDEPALAERFKAELEASTDGFLLVSTGSQLASFVQRGGGGPELAPAVELAERLRKRAAEHGVPGSYAQTIVGGIRGGVPGGVSGGVQGGIQAGASLPPQPPPVVERVMPEYPPLAKQARIQGTVSLMVRTGPDGNPLNTTVRSGPPLLAAAAREAVGKWVFRPRMENGQPVEGTWTVDVSFRLPPRDQGASEGTVELSVREGAGPRIGDLTPPSRTQRIRVGGQVQMTNLVNKIEPVYPPLALQARIQGTVRFNLTVGSDGHAKDIQLESGHPLLVPAAQEAVRQWVWRPTLLNGQPVEVVTVIDVPFTLPEPQ